MLEYRWKSATSPHDLKILTGFETIDQIELALRQDQTDKFNHAKETFGLEERMPLSYVTLGEFPKETRECLFVYSLKDIAKDNPLIFVCEDIRMLYNFLMTLGAATWPIIDPLYRVRIDNKDIYRLRHEMIRLRRNLLSIRDGNAYLSLNWQEQLLATELFTERELTWPKKDSNRVKYFFHELWACDMEIREVLVEDVDICKFIYDDADENAQFATVMFFISDIITHFARVNPNFSDRFNDHVRRAFIQTWDEEQYRMPMSHLFQEPGPLLDLSPVINAAFFAADDRAFNHFFTAYPLISEAVGPYNMYQINKSSSLTAAKIRLLSLLSSAPHIINAFVSYFEIDSVIKEQMKDVARKTDVFPIGVVDPRAAEYIISPSRRQQGYLYFFVRLFHRILNTNAIATVRQDMDGFAQAHKEQLAACVIAAQPGEKTDETKIRCDATLPVNMLSVLHALTRSELVYNVNSLANELTRVAESLRIIDSGLGFLSASDTTINRFCINAEIQPTDKFTLLGLIQPRHKSLFIDTFVHMKNRLRKIYKMNKVADEIVASNVPATIDRDAVIGMLNHMNAHYFVFNLHGEAFLRAPQKLLAAFLEQADATHEMVIEYIMGLGTWRLHLWARRFDSYFKYSHEMLDLFGQLESLYRCHVRYLATLRLTLAGNELEPSPSYESTINTLQRMTTFSPVYKKLLRRENDWLAATLFCSHIYSDGCPFVPTRFMFRNPGEYLRKMPYGTIELWHVSPSYTGLLNLQSYFEQ